VTKFKKNLRRFVLHTVFAAAAALMLFLGGSAADIGIPAEYQTLAVALATAAASFFRGQAEENG